MAYNTCSQLSNHALFGLSSKSCIKLSLSPLHNTSQHYRLMRFRFKTRWASHSQQIRFYVFKAAKWQWCTCRL